MRILMSVLLLVLSAPVQAGGVFDFLGQADLPSSGGKLPGALSMVGQLHDPSPLASPLALDFDNNDYTICLSCDALLSDTPSVKTFGPCVVTLHENPSNNSDYTDPDTFCTGTMILSGEMASLTRTRLLTWLHNVAGDVTWSGGSMFGDLNPLEHSGWALLCTANSNSPHAANMDEVWDGKIEREDDVSNDAQSFGAIKSLYR